MAAPERYREQYESEILEPGLRLVKKAIERGLSDDANDAAIKTALSAFKESTERVYGKAVETKQQTTVTISADALMQRRDELREALETAQRVPKELVNGSTPVGS